MSASSAALLRACALLLCLVAESRQVSITEFTVPKSIEVGENLELRCRYELDVNDKEVLLFVKWWWLPTTNLTEGRKLIYQRISGQVPESLPNKKLEIKQNDTIILKEVTPDDSGIYECEVSNLGEVRKREELIVFSRGNGPELNISTVVDISDNSEDLLIECEAAEVAPLPQLLITINGKEINITETLSGPNNNSMYSIHANASLNKEDVEEGEIKCELLYINPNITHPQFVDTENYVTAAPDDAPSSTPVPEDAAQPESTPEPLNSRDVSYRVYCSWVLPTVAAMLTQLHAYNFFLM